VPSVVGMEVTRALVYLVGLLRSQLRQELLGDLECRVQLLLDRHIVKLLISGQSLRIVLA